jgi:hypothetical protein
VHIVETLTCTVVDMKHYHRHATQFSSGLVDVGWPVLAKYITIEMCKQCHDLGEAVDNSVESRYCKCFGELIH